MKWFPITVAHLLVASAFAQVAQGPATGSVPSGVVVNTNNFEASDAPDPVGPIMRIAPNKVPVPPLPMPPNMPPPTAPEGSNYFEDPSVAGLLDSPPPITLSSFQGIPQTNSIPPDPHVAAGPNHIIQVVNTSFRISDKNGTTLKTITANAWFNSAFGGNSGAFDPKVLYDHFAGRWIMVWLQQSDANQTGTFLLSVSDDNDPIGTWYNWALPNHFHGTTFNGGWTDYQGVGFDQQAIYITGNHFGFNNTGYQGVKIRIIGKAQLYNNTAGPVTYTDFWNLRDLFGNDVFGTRPTIVYSNPNEYYLVGKPNFNGGTYFALYRITNPLTTPSISCVHVAATAWSNAPNVNQLGNGTPLIEGGSSHIRNEPTYRGFARQKPFGREPAIMLSPLAGPAIAGATIMGPHLIRQTKIMYGSLPNTRPQPIRGERGSTDPASCRSAAYGSTHRLPHATLDELRPAFPATHSRSKSATPDRAT